MSTSLQINLDELPQQVESGALEVSGAVNSFGNVLEIAYQLNEQGTSLVCEDCGEDPQFAIPLSLEAGDNQIVISATDAYANQAEVTVHIYYEPAPAEELPPVELAPLELLGCNNVSQQIEYGVYGTELDFAVQASGGCDETVQVICTAESGDYFSVGKTNVDCAAYDSCGQQAECSFKVIVTEEEAPETEPASCREQNEVVVQQAVKRNMLWPPNHKLINVGLLIDVSDTCEEYSAENVITEVWSDEPEVPERGDGSGNFAPDAKKSDENELRLRAERRGTEDGRVYLVVSKIEGVAGSFSCSTVVVPHDNSKKVKKIKKGKKAQKSMNKVLAQAEDAIRYCQQNEGAPPLDYFRHGVSKARGPKQ